MRVKHSVAIMSKTLMMKKPIMSYPRSPPNAFETAGSGRTNLTKAKKGKDANMQVVVPDKAEKRAV